MDISWLGLSCVRLKGREVAVVTDPFPKTGALSMGKPQANVVTVSNWNPQHSYLEGVTGDPKTIDAPGEYEVAGISIMGFSTRTGEGTRNTIFKIELDDVAVCHLGALGTEPSADQLEEMNGVDVLIVPAGLSKGLTVDQLAEIVGQIEPKVVIPVAYKADMLDEGLQPVEPFLKALGVKDLEPKPKLSVTKSNLPTELQVVLLSR